MIGGWNEIFDKNSKIILGTMCILIFSMFFVLHKFGYFENQRLDEILNKNYKAIVVLKYIDIPNHSTPKIKLSNGLELIDYWENKKTLIKVGDSVIKEKMSTNLIIKRDSQIIYSISLLK